MGQRSQIYIRYNGQLKVANYFQWNYGERMISRARYTIEKIKDEIEYQFAIDEKMKNGYYKEFCTVNFDMKDKAYLCDIFKEWEDFGKDETENYNDFLFNQDNNDGQLLIDVICNDTEKKIKYCFTEWSLADKPKALDGFAYMDWDSKGWEESEYISANGKKACNRNIKWLEKKAELMTTDDIIEYVNKNYEEVE